MNHIHLIGPGGAGKSTIAPVLANTLGLPIIDLDLQYMQTRNISDDVEMLGYEFYVQTNVNLYLSLLDKAPTSVIATSSGFMTYNQTLHPAIEDIHQRITSCSLTICLMPSWDLETCVEAIVERQMAKSHFTGTAKENEQVIRQRFPIYSGLSNIQVETSQSVNAVVSQIRRRLSEVSISQSG